MVERIRRKQKEKQKNELEKQSVSRTTFQVSRNEGTPNHGANQVQRNETQGREVYDRKALIEDLKAQADKQKQTSQHRVSALHGNSTINRIQKGKEINGESSKLMKGFSIRGESKDEKDALERILKGTGKRS